MYNIGGMHRNTIGGYNQGMGGGGYGGHFQQQMQQHPQQSHHLAKKAQNMHMPFEMMLENIEPISKFPSLDPSTSSHIIGANQAAIAAQKIKDKFEGAAGYKTERNNATKHTAESLTQEKDDKASDKDKVKQGQWEMHKCPKCGPEVDLIRKRVGICLNIMAKKDGIDKYDVSALTCSLCSLGFASKNKYIFYCDACDHKMHPDGDCLLAEQYHARKRM